MRELGQLIKRRRLALGLTQWDLANRLPETVDQSYVSKIELGRVGRPEKERLREIAVALEIDPNDLFRVADYMIEEPVEPVYEGVAIPLYGSIPADSIRLTEPTEEEPVRVLAERLAGAHSPFALRVSGDCLRSLGIYSDDIVILDRPDGRAPRDGQLVAVRVNNDGYTLKRWVVVSGGMVELRDGDGHVAQTVTPLDDVDIIGFFVTFTPIAPR